MMRMMKLKKNKTALVVTDDADDADDENLPKIHVLIKMVLVRAVPSLDQLRNNCG